MEKDEGRKLLKLESKEFVLIFLFTLETVSYLRTFMFLNLFSIYGILSII